MGGDLNLKKSWHPHLRKNQERVWKEENAALQERKLIEKLAKERQEERDLEALRALQEQAGGKTAQKRVDWMYSGPSGDGAGLPDEREGFLLGKRRIDQLLKNDEAKQTLSKGAAASIDTIDQGSAGNARDIQSKIAQDPLLAIQKQKMEMQLKMAKEAQKRAKMDEKRAKEKEREGKHRHRHSRRDRSRSRDSSDERERRHRHRHRSRSPRRHRDDRDDHRRRERSVSRGSTGGRDRRHRHHRRSRSPRRSDRYDNDERDKYNRRSRSPHRRDRDERDDYRRRSPSPYRRQARHDRPDYRPRPYRPAEEEPTQPQESAADKLAKMQAEAEALEKQREERVRLREAEDAAAEERHKKKLDGGQRFASGMRMKATEDLDLGDVMARGRAGFKKEIDA